MSLSPEAQAALETEQHTLDAVLASLRGQIQKGSQRLRTESIRSRDLTSALVAARRVEDKAMLASDEAVSHGIRDQKRDEMQSLATLIAKPYFARLVVEEEVDGTTKQFEYKIGFAANTDCRIIDWRKAPISKLYYEYKEADEYSEEIQGRERTGTVVLRNTVEIEKEKLKRVTCRHGSFLREGTGWRDLGGKSKGARTAGTLPQILSLITPEQFRTITEEASTAILIQGIAGSGKTTVALHRLAWLLHHENSDLKAEEAVVIVLSKALKRYVAGTLPSIDIHGVDVLTFAEWAARSAKLFTPHLVNNDEFIRPADKPGAAVERLTRSLALLRALEEAAVKAPTLGPEQLVLAAFSRPDRIIELDDTRLIDKDLISQGTARAKSNFERGCIDSCADALLIRAIQMLNPGVSLKDGRIGRYGHIVTDEVQDMSSVELACIIGAVPDSQKLTLVGDIAQKVNASASFPGWEKLRQFCSLKDSMSKYISLSVSHRSTLPIMQLADHIQERRLVTHGRPGRVPIWFRGDTEEKGIKAAIDWLTKAMERYPGSLTAVICASTLESKQTLSFLSPTFGAAVRLGDDSDFSFDEGIIVTDAVQVKGLEFMNVLLWNPSTKNYPKGEQSRNLLYIAASRAEENLCVVTWDRPSSILPQFGSKLFRNFDLIEEQEEEEIVSEDSE